MDTGKLKEIFDSMDSDKSGELSMQELIDVLVKIGQTQDDAKANVYYILKDCDKDENNKLNFEEFSRGLMKQK